MKTKELLITLIKLIFGILIFVNLILNIIVLKSINSLEYDINNISWDVADIDSSVEEIEKTVSDIKDNVDYIEYYLR